MIEIISSHQVNCRFQINLGLSGDLNWAGREKIINDGKRNASVTDKVIDSIINLQPVEEETGEEV